MANEEDTVTVGQDLFVIEAGEVGESKYSLQVLLGLVLIHFLFLAPAPPPTKEASQPAEKRTKDPAEPADQQVDKSLPKDAAPSPAERVQEMKEPVKNKEVEKIAAKEPKQEEKSKQEPPKPAAGSRGETRVRFVFRIAAQISQQCVIR